MAAEQIEQGERTLADLIEAYKDELLVIIFFARWCKPCMQLLHFVLPTVAKEAREGVVICPMNVDETENYTASRNHRATNVPAILFFWEGKEVGRIGGMVEPKVFLHEMRIHQKKKSNA